MNQDTLTFLMILFSIPPAPPPDPPVPVVSLSAVRTAPRPCTEKPDTAPTQPCLVFAPTKPVHAVQGAAN